jgi:exonuclease 3'-5' domain-containing protein 1
MNFIDTNEAVEYTCSNLFRKKQVAIDLEGVDLGRTGTISVITIATNENEIFIFDITTLGEEAFKSGLRRLLEDSRVKKIFYDLRKDCEALFQLYNIKVYGAQDCQIAYMMMPENRSRKYLFGLKNALTYSAAYLPPLPDNYESLKAEGVKYFDPRQGG